MSYLVLARKYRPQSFEAVVDQDHVTRTLINAIAAEHGLFVIEDGFEYIDQGGSLETSRPTSHDSPTYIEEGIIHYCVPNLSSVIARTATNAFYNACKPYIHTLAQAGAKAAIENNPAIANAVYDAIGVRPVDGPIDNRVILDLLSKKKRG